VVLQKAPDCAQVDIGDVEQVTSQGLALLSPPTSRAAPRGDPQAPLRSRCATMIGAVEVVVTANPERAGIPMRSKTSAAPTNRLPYPTGSTSGSSEHRPLNTRSSIGPEPFRP